LREVHWHSNGDEWLYVIEGQARMGVFAGQGQARTFHLQAGDAGYVPVAMGRYLENTGSTNFDFSRRSRVTASLIFSGYLDGRDTAGTGASPSLT
jgi:oxalate decarboxylase/phosphoglucose isomerase-like protein (cupin superfamily)